MANHATKSAPAPAKNQKQEKPQLSKEQKKALREQERAKLTSLRSTVAAQYLDSNGLLNTHDVALLGYDDDVHQQLSRSDFANETLWLLFRASAMRARATKMMAKADQLEREATTATSFGDPEKRKQVKRLQKLAGAMAELKATLAAEGVNIEDLLKNL